MKKLIFIFLIMTTVIFSQGWNSAVQTTIPYANGTGNKLDLVSNKDGNHILVQYDTYSTSYLKYYLLSSSGSVVRSYTVENQSVAFSSIAGNDEKIYIVYKQGNYIKAKKSTDAGQNWDDISSLSIGNYNTTNVDAVYGNDGLHVVYDLEDGGNNHYETYYYQLNFYDQWVDYKQVTDYGSDEGIIPTISFSTERVHVSYHDNGEAKTRDKYQNDWEDPQSVLNYNSWGGRVHAGSSKLFDFYYKLEIDLGSYSTDLYVKERSLEGSTWSSGTLLRQYVDYDTKVPAANTDDGKTHIIYDGPSSVIYRSYNGSSWSSEYTVGSDWLSPQISSASNDVFVVWGGYTNNYVYFRQNNQTPQPPNTTLGGNWGENPIISWTNNGENDIDHYVLKKEYNFGSGWGTPAYVNPAISPYTDLNITRSHQGDVAARYSVQAVDKSSLASAYSDYVSTDGQSNWKKSGDNQVENIIVEYALHNNFPNPFNPTTQINYTIKEGGFVTLIVFDILGNEVAVLVNEPLNKGNYAVNFNASNLSSGIYIYTVKVNDFTASHKMILLK